MAADEAGAARNEHVLQLHEHLREALRPRSARCRRAPKWCPAAP
jgi:hypothetical protein